MACTFKNSAQHRFPTNNQNYNQNSLLQTDTHKPSLKSLLSHFGMLLLLSVTLNFAASKTQALQAGNGITGLYNTGITDAGSLASDGNSDSHWTIAAWRGGNSPVSAFVALQNWPAQPGYWMSDSNTSKWLSPVANVYLNAVPGRFTYQTTFTVTGDPTKFGFNATVSADDQIVGIVLNGKTIATDLDSNFTKWTTVNVSSGLVSGTNSLQFVVQNYGTISNPSGSRAEFAPYSLTPPTPPPASSNPPLSVVSILPNDDSAKITFVAYPGAQDYRIINLAAPNSCKYAGYAGINGLVTIEMNGLDPKNGSDLVIQATDDLGAFQDMDPYLMPPITGPNAMPMIINGHCDPNAMPNVLATSQPFHVTCQPRFLNGAQAFFDNFQQNKPFTPGILDPDLEALHTFSGQVCYEEFENDKWKVTAFDHDPQNSRFFFMGEHFMDILYDFHATLRGKTVMVPKSYPTLQSGQVLHATFEVDPHLSLNRTVGLLVVPANNRINYPADGSTYTTEGNIFDWQIAADRHYMTSYLAGVKRGIDSSVNNPYQPDRWVQQWASGPMGGGINGGDEDLDRRHRFDVYLSSTRVVIVEEGRVMNDVNLSQVYAGPPGNVFDDSLPWLNGQPVKIAFYHYLYHSEADRYYLQSGEMWPRPSYWLDRRPYSDERHWDNMGFEVLNGFPKF